MRVLLSTYGSRGDVEPIAALAAALRTLGAQVNVCVPPDREFTELLARASGAAPTTDFASLSEQDLADVLARADMPLTPAFAPIREWAHQMIQRTAEAPPEHRAAMIAERAAEIMLKQFDALSNAAEGCDAIVATGLFPSTAAARCVAEQRGLAYFYAGYCASFLPSSHHPPHAYPGRPLPEQATDNRTLWQLDIETKQILFGAGYDRLRASIGLPPVSNPRDHVFTDRPWLAADPILGPWHPTDLLDVHPTGAWILPDQRPLPPELQAFLDAGAPPVYVGFGSMSLHASKDAARIAIDAIRAQGRRVLLARGWAELALIDDHDDCYITGDVNQQALFGRMAAVVHHGGAGTTTTAARAGVPQVVVAQIGDQPYWAQRVAELGIGTAHDGPTPTFESLSAALQASLAAEVCVRASDLAGRIRGDGAMVAARELLKPRH